MARGKGNGFAASMQDAKRRRTEMEKRKESSDSDSRSADTVFQDIMKSATPADIFGEYCWFKKNLPKNLLKRDREELVKKVKGHMRIGEVKKALVETSLDEDEDITILGKRFPILDALSCKIGISLQNVLAPPVQNCLLCGKLLTRNNKPSMAALHTLSGSWSFEANFEDAPVSGPEIASKYSAECRHCKGIFNFRNQFESNDSVWYQVV